VISVNKYPHLSNVLNREFDDVSKNTEQVGIKEIIQQLQRLVDIQSAEAERLKNEREAAEVEEEKKTKEKEAAEDKTGTGLTPEKLKEARKKSADRIAEHRAKMEDLRTRRDERKNKGKLSQEDKKNLRQRDKLFGKPTQRFAQKERRQLEEAKVNFKKKKEEEYRRKMEQARKKINNMGKQPNINNNAGKNFHRRFKSRFKKSEDDESNWFSAVRV